MSYKIEYTEEVKKKIKKMDRSVIALILGYIDKNLQGIEDPRALGKSLVGNHQGKWRYRVGDYRILRQIEDEVVTIKPHFFYNATCFQIDLY